MKMYLALVTLLVSSGAFADCFNFMTGEGPQSIGQAHFAGPAQMVCLQAVQSVMSDKHTSLVFSDAKG